MTDTFDYVIVGGGTAGAVVAARLAEYTDASIGVLEWGPSDELEPRALEIARWAEMLEGEYDLDYRSVPQPRGNSAIRQSRARILGGCATHNTMIMWRPPAADLAEWVECGADGWDAEVIHPYYDRMKERITCGPIPAKDRNPYLRDATLAAAEALGVPVRDEWNAGGEPADGAGYAEIGYDPASGIRSSSSVAYLHPLAEGPDNLRVMLECRAVRLVVGSGRVKGVACRDRTGAETIVAARHEVIVCAGAIDTPRLLQLSGIGSRDTLRAAGVPVVHELAGVGENLIDHPEGLVVWERARPLEAVHATDWDAVVLARIDSAELRPDVLMHIPLVTWAMHAEAAGFPTPERSISMTPNVARPRSRGRVWITTASPDDPPSIDYRYFTDPGGHDERMLVEGVKLARRIAAQEPMRSWIVRETFPGPAVVSDEDISAVARATHHTVYHVSGTCRMGAVDDDTAVVDPRLRVRGLSGLRVVDASVFPVLTSVNPVGTVLVVAERAADLIADDWTGADRRAPR